MINGKKNGKIETPLWNSVTCITKRYVDMSSALVSVQCSALGSVQFTKNRSHILAEIISAENLLPGLGHN